jgi:hypothetical protein
MPRKGSKRPRIAVEVESLGGLDETPATRLRNKAKINYEESSTEDELDSSEDDYEENGQVDKELVVDVEMG